MRVYSLLSHTLAYLPYQVAAFRRFMPDAEIIAVEDGIHLPDEWKGSLGVSSMPAPPNQFRAFKRYQTIIDATIRNSRETCMVVHGDAIPMRPIDSTGMLGGNALACACFVRDEIAKSMPVWAIVDPSKYRRNIMDEWPIDEVATHTARFKEGHLLEAVPELREHGYDHGKLVWQWFGLFLHVNRMSTWGLMPERDRENIRILDAMFPGVSMGEPDYGPPKKQRRVASPPKNLTLIGTTEDRKAICGECFDRPLGCWKARDYSCQKSYRAAEQHACEHGTCPIGNHGKRPELVQITPVNREPCPSCDLPIPEIRTIEDVHATVREILARDLTPPTFTEPMGIVTTGEGRYEPGIVVMVKLLRDELKCTLPVKIFHNGQWRTNLSKYDVELIDSRKHQAYHPAKQYGGWESKTYGVIHSGFERCLFLDADAYCVADPTPLFSLLDNNRLAVWYDYGPGWACGKQLDNLVCDLHHQNGGQYLVNLSTYWTEMIAQRFLDNHSHIWYREGRLGDECSHRLIRNLVNDRGVIGADWVDRTRGVGILCRYPAYGPAYIAHRMRKEAKLFLGTVPRSSAKWPLETKVMRLFQELSPGYLAAKEAERIAKSPQARRAKRHAVLNRRR